jgi:uncharacterized FAD-dependent dehydrogenase
MCPGGEVVNASSENGMLALNGMSYSKRASGYSNAAIVVTCRPSDYGSNGALAGIEFQREIERKAFKAGGGSWRAPAQGLIDFLNAKRSDAVKANSYGMGTVSADLKALSMNGNKPPRCSFRSMPFFLLLKPGVHRP